MFPKEVEITFLTIKLIIASLGLIGNFALFHNYWKKNKMLRFNVLMLMLIVFDIGYLTSEIFAEIMKAADQNEVNAKVQFIYNFTFSGSVYTTALMVAERYLVLCRGRDTDKVPVIWTIVAMIIVLIVLNIDTIIIQPENGAIGESLPVILPVIPTIVFNHLLFKRYRTLINSEDYASSATNDTLKQSIFRAKLSMAISSIYVTSQVLTVVQLIMDMVLAQLDRREDAERYLMIQDVDRCIRSVIRILKVLMCSVNFLVYRCMITREKKLLEKRKQERQMRFANTNGSTTECTSTTNID